MQGIGRGIFRGQWLVVAAALVQGGCGGGGANAGIDRLGISSGTVNGFGSVIVNGVEYETGSGTQFQVDDLPGTQDDLAVGQVVTIFWRTRDNGQTFQAETVVYDDAVEGPVSQIDLEAGSFVALGQTVLVDADTSFDGAIVPGDLSGLAVGDQVKVSGFADAGGAIRATRILRQGNVAEFEARGIVSAVTSTTFTLADLVVNTSGLVAGIRDCEDGTVDVGDLVEAKGPGLNGQGQLVATEVECEAGDVPAGEDGVAAHLEGFITGFDSPASFRVTGVDVDASAAVITGGTAQDLGNNVKVLVRGAFDGAGILVAEDLEILGGPGNSGSTGQAQLQVAVQSVDLQSGILVAAGVTIRTDARTRLEDKAGGAGKDFGLGDLVPGDLVEIRGHEMPGNQVRARLLERQPDAGGDRRLRAMLDTVADPSFSLLGRSVLTDGQTQFRAINKQPITGTEFFGLVAPGDTVEVRFGPNAGDPLLARQVWIERLAN